MPEDIPVKLKLKNVGPPPGPPREPSPTHDVKALLAENLNHEAQRPLNQPEAIPQPKRFSKRLRNYLLLLILGDLAIVGVVYAVSYPGHPNVVTAIYGFSGVVLLSVGITWVMFAVMDKY